MNRETDLWAWFLFRSGLPTGRAKALLAAWEEHGLSLGAALSQLPARTTALGLTSAEAAVLKPPAELPEVSAIRWDDALYPAGLRALPLKLRPALLFYRGEPSLLSLPVVYLAPGEVSARDAQRVREVINLVMDERLLLAGYRPSAQLRILLEELAYGAGEALLFADTGLERWTPLANEDVLVAEGRLLVVSPLPPETARQDALDVVLQQVAMAAADRVILSGDPGQVPHALVGLDEKPALTLSTVSSGTPISENVEAAEAPVDVLPWLDGLYPGMLLTDTEETAAATAVAESPSGAPAPAEEPPSGETALGPAPTPQEILNTLRKGGEVPEALRKRLLGES